MPQETHDIPADVLALPVDALDLSVRAANVLERLSRGMTIEDLCKHTERDILLIKHSTRRVLKEIKAALRQLDPGLRLAIEPPPPPRPTRADDGMVAMIEREWAETLKLEEATHRNVYVLQSLSMEFSSTLSRLRDLGNTWRARAQEAEEAMREMNTRINELEAQLAALQPTAGPVGDPQ